MQKLIYENLRNGIWHQFNPSNWLAYSCGYQIVLNNGNMALTNPYNNLFDGIWFVRRNNTRPTRANHGKHPLSHWARRIKKEASFYGPRQWRNELKRRFRNSENKIYPGSPYGPWAQ